MEPVMPISGLGVRLDETIVTKKDQRWLKEFMEERNQRDDEISRVMGMNDQGLLVEKQLTYLCSPYNHEQPDVRYARYMQVCKVAAILMERGVFVYSPIAHNDGVAYYGKLQTGWDFWEKYDTAFLQCCKDMLVVTMDGWASSKGIRAEIAIAHKLGIPITLIDEQGNPL